MMSKSCSASTSAVGDAADDVAAIAELRNNVMVCKIPSSYSINSIFILVFQLISFPFAVFFIIVLFVSEKHEMQHSSCHISIFYF